MSSDSVGYWRHRDWDGIGRYWRHGVWDGIMFVLKSKKIAGVGKYILLYHFA